MDSAQARLILSAARWNGRDDADPQVAAALAQLKHDPALAQWWSEQRALDEAVAARVQASPVPDTLKTSVLAGRKLVPVSFWRNRRAWLALAAGVVLLASLAIGFWPRPTAVSGADLAAFRRDMGAFLDGLNRLDFRSTKLPQVEHWLAQNGGFANAALPLPLAANPPVGCRVIEWNHQKVTLICFRTGANGQGKVVHLLIAPRPSGIAPASENATLTREGKWDAATWADERYLYFLAGQDAAGELRQLAPRAG